MSKFGILGVMAGLLILVGQEQKSGDPGHKSLLLAQLQSEEVGYDEELAREAKADEFGMRTYVMAFLKAGPKRDHDAETAERIQKAHMANINKMASEGKLAVAGPFLDATEVRGIYIFNVQSVEEAKALTETDPAVQAGRLSMELHPWYGSAAISMVTTLHRKMEKKNILK